MHRVRTGKETNIGMILAISFRILPVEFRQGELKASTRDVAVAKGDFNGDGFADLAVGAPGKDVPAPEPGSSAVFVIYGSSSGLLPGGGGIPATQFWSQDSPACPRARKQATTSGPP